MREIILCGAVGDKLPFSGEFQNLGFHRLGKPEMNLSELSRNVRNPTQIQPDLACFSQTHR